MDFLNVKDAMGQVSILTGESALHTIVIKANVQAALGIKN